MKHARYVPASTMHRGRAYDDMKYPRDMRRVTLADSAPTLEQAV